MTVRRKYLDDDETFGFVIAVSDKWVVLQDWFRKFVSTRWFSFA